MATETLQGWDPEKAGREAGERERGERHAPIVLREGQPKRHFIPVLPQPTAAVVDSVRRAGKVSGASKRLARKLDTLLGKVD